MNITTETRAASVIQFIQNSIHDDDIDLSKKLLSTIPVQQLSKKISDKLLYDFLSISVLYNRTNIALLIFETWEIPYPANRGPVSLYTRLYLSPRYSPDILKFCSKVYPTYTFSECIDELTYLDDDYNITVGCHKLLKVYGEQTKNTYINLADISKDRNAVVYNFIISKLRKINDYAEIPDYMIGPNILPQESEIVVPEYKMPAYNIPSDEKMADMMLEGMKDFGFVIDQIESARNMLMIKISTSTLSEKKKLLEPIFELKFKEETLQKDTTLFALFGPSNPHYGSTREEMEYGGARMLLSGAYDYDDDNEDYQLDWFSGYCWQCNLRIRRRWHALRRPVPHGGWKGCYCSFECLNEGIERSDTDEIVNRLLADIFEEQIENIGILDRIPDDEYDKYLDGRLELDAMTDTEANFFGKYGSVKIDESKKENTINIDDIGYTKNLIETPDIYKDDKEIIRLMSSKEMVIIINEPTQYNEMLEISKTTPCILYLTRKNCKYCRDMDPIYDIASKEYKTIKFYKIDTNNGKVRKISWDIGSKAVPLFVRYENGLEIDRFVGAHEDRLIDLIKK